MAKKHRFDLRSFEVKPNSRVNLGKWSTKASKTSLGKELADEALAADVAALQSAQDRLYASNKYALLVILQGMDASGKDGVVATLGPGMRGAVWMSVAAFGIWFIALTITRVQSTRAEREVRELRERGLDLGVLQ